MKEKETSGHKSKHRNRGRERDIWKERHLERDIWRENSRKRERERDIWRERDKWKDIYSERHLERHSICLVNISMYLYAAVSAQDLAQGDI